MCDMEKVIEIRILLKPVDDLDEVENLKERKMVVKDVLHYVFDILKAEINSGMAIDHFGVVGQRRESQN